jgi:hypothetical protein
MIVFETDTSFNMLVESRDSGVVELRKSIEASNIELNKSNRSFSM